MSTSWRHTWEAIFYPLTIIDNPLPPPMSHTYSNNNEQPSKHALVWHIHMHRQVHNPSIYEQSSSVAESQQTLLTKQWVFLILLPHSWTTLVSLLLLSRATMLDGCLLPLSTYDNQEATINPKQLLMSTFLPHACTTSISHFSHMTTSLSSSSNKHHIYSCLCTHMNHLKACQFTYYVLM